MSKKNWPDVRKEFETLVFKGGVEEASRAIHVHRSTIYRLINRQTTRPSGPLRTAVEKFVANATAEKGKVDN